MYKNSTIIIFTQSELQNGEKQQALDYFLIGERSYMWEQECKKTKTDAWKRRRSGRRREKTDVSTTENHLK